MSCDIAHDSKLIDIEIYVIFCHSNIYEVLCLIFFKYVLQTIADIFDGQFPYSDDSQIVTSHNFHRFLLDYQKDFGFGKDQKAIPNFICDFIQDPQREIQEPYLSIPEVFFISFQSLNIMV